MRCQSDSSVSDGWVGRANKGLQVREAGLSLLHPPCTNTNSPISAGKKAPRSVTTVSQILPLTHQSLADANTPFNNCHDFKVTFLGGWLRLSLWNNNHIRFTPVRWNRPGGSFSFYSFDVSTLTWQSIILHSFVDLWLNVPLNPSVILCRLCCVLFQKLLKCFPDQTQSQSPCYMQAL